MNIAIAKSVIKCINRRVKKTRPFAGGRRFGVDYTTWNVCYPQTAQLYSKAAEIFYGRTGRFMPRF
jgi:hypothetical protein